MERNFVDNTVAGIVFDPSHTTSVKLCPTWKVVHAIPDAVTYLRFTTVGGPRTGTSSTPDFAQDAFDAGMFHYSYLNEFSNSINSLSGLSNINGWTGPEKTETVAIGWATDPYDEVYDRKTSCAEVLFGSQQDHRAEIELPHCRTVHGPWDGDNEHTIKLHNLPSHNVSAEVVLCVYPCCLTDRMPRTSLLYCTLSHPHHDFCFAM